MYATAVPVAPRAAPGAQTVACGAGWWCFVAAFAGTPCMFSWCCWGWACRMQECFSALYFVCVSLARAEMQCHAVIVLASLMQLPAVLWHSPPVYGNVNHATHSCNPRKPQAHHSPVTITLHDIMWAELAGLVSFFKDTHTCTAVPAAMLHDERVGASCLPATCTHAPNRSWSALSEKVPRASKIKLWWCLAKKATGDSPLHLVCWRQSPALSLAVESAVPP